MRGDPRQLEQPQQGSHPEGTDLSAVAHLASPGGYPAAWVKDASLKPVAFVVRRIEALHERKDEHPTPRGGIRQMSTAQGQYLRGLGGRPSLEPARC